MILTMKEKNKIEVIQLVMNGTIEMNSASRILNHSIWQIYRMLNRLRDNGLEGLQHGNKGKKSSRRIKKAIRKKIVELARGKFSDINDTHLSEILLREEKIPVSRQTLRKILREEGVPAKLKRRHPKHFNGSPHDWLERRGPCLTLIGDKDDATSFVCARFETAETTWRYMNLMKEVFLSNGLPSSLYSDRYTIFHSPKESTIVEQLNDIRSLTQFRRVMEELGITLIKAWSAPAKGRIENQWKTFQDRLVVEMRLKEIKTMEANRFLPSFLKAYNKQFCVTPKEQVPVFRPSPSSSQLDRILCLKEMRTVAKDHTISFEELVLQIPPPKKYYSIARQKVEVLQLKDGSIEIVYKELTVARFRPESVSRLAEIYGDRKCQLKKVARLNKERTRGALSSPSARPFFVGDL